MTRPALAHSNLEPIQAVLQRPTISQLAEALDQFDVRGTCRLVAYELLRYWKPGGTVFPAVGTLADGVGKSPSTVRRALARLDRIGLWTRQRRSSETNVYGLRLPGPDPVTHDRPPPRNPVTHDRPPPRNPVTHDCPPQSPMTAKVTREVTTTVRTPSESAAEVGKFRCSGCGSPKATEGGETCDVCAHWSPRLRVVHQRQNRKAGYVAASSS